MARQRETINGDCFIILRHTYRNHLNDLHDHEDRFGSVHEFLNTLHWSPERSMAINYLPELNSERLMNPRVSNVRLSIWVDGKETPLENIDQLISFLESNLGVADRLQYRSNGDYRR